jgi:putative two-component system response regulator
LTDTQIRVLVVDDEEPARRLLLRLLENEGFEADAVSSAAEAVDAVKTRSYGLVLTDFDMPGESGLELVQKLRPMSPEVACVMVTGRGSTNIGKVVIRAGAYGYISKPVDPDELLISVVNAIERRRLEIEAGQFRERLEKTVAERTAELWTANVSLEHSIADVTRSQEETVAKLAVAAEFRDDETAKHVHRMSRYCEAIAVGMGIDRERSSRLRVASVMHDVGKIGIPDSILRKPGPLSPEERASMEQHAEMGNRILSPSESPLLQLAAEVALTHHERWDGTGYPNRLAGAKIPLEGRIAAVADVFDAITTDRVYRKAFSFPQAFQIMKDSVGTHFDPDVAAAFFDGIDKILKIREELDGGR